jgi:hypothetical protein
MTAATFLPSSPLRALREFFWARPDWWSIVLCTIGWWAMLNHGWQHASCGPHHWMTFSQEVLYWMLMVAAMMLPLSLDTVRLTAARSLWNRRHRAIAGFLIGYFAPWFALGIAVGSLRAAAWTHLYAASAAAFALAALWQITPIYSNSLIACHRRPILSPLGWRADMSAISYGWNVGVPCLTSCWPLMVACAFTGHDLVAMIGGMALGVCERHAFRPRTRIMIAGTLLLAGYYGAVTYFNR